MAWNLLELHKTNPRNRLDGSADSFFILWGNFRKSWQVVCKSRGIAGKVPRNRWKLRQNREKVPRNFLELPRFFQMVPQDVQGVPRNGGGVAAPWRACLGYPCAFCCNAPGVPRSLNTYLTLNHAVMA